MLFHDSDVSWNFTVTFSIFLQSFSEKENEVNMQAISTESFLDICSAVLEPWNITCVSEEPNLNLKGVATECQYQSQSYFTTDGQSVSMSWCRAPLWGP
jgi:hypothetical protein